MINYDQHESLKRTILLARDYVSRQEATDEDIIRALTSQTVAIIADSRTVSSAAGQSAVAAFAGQVMMMGMSLRLVMPEATLSTAQPPIRGDRLRAGLLDLAGDSVPGVEATIALVPEPNDLVFVFGSTPYSLWNTRSWRVSGTRWSGAIGPAAVSAAPWGGRFPIGALVAATIAAAEPFKAALRTLTGSEFLRAVRTCRVSLGPEDACSSTVDLRYVDCISGGAITHAALHALLRIPDLRAVVRVFEPELLDLSNLNRYALGRRSFAGHRKAQSLTGFSTPRFHLIADHSRFTEETARSGDLAPSVLVGVDHIPSRWAAQRAWPAWVGVGATSHFNAVISDHVGYEACSACLHPADDPNNEPIPTVSFVSYWAGLVLATKLLLNADGARMHGLNQVVRVSGLLLDGDYSFHPHPLKHSPSCPVGCQKERRRRAS